MLLIDDKDGQVGGAMGEKMTGWGVPPPVCVCVCVYVCCVT
jgi:hypothetical protein